MIIVVHNNWVNSGIYSVIKIFLREEYAYQFYVFFEPQYLVSLSCASVQFHSLKRLHKPVFFMPPKILLKFNW